MCIRDSLYAASAQRVDGTKQVEPARRQQFKNFFMAYIFGAGTKRLGEQTDMSYSEVMKLQTQFKELFPAYNRWREDLNSGTGGYTPDGYSLTTDDGYEYKRTAWAVQSSAAYMLKRGIIKLRKKYPQYHQYLVCVVHDEVILHVPERHAKKAAKALQKCLEVKGWIDMPAQAMVVEDWSQAK